MAKKSQKPPYRHVAAYLTPELIGELEQEARDRRRKLGPTIVEILFEYFKAKKEKPGNANPPVAADSMSVS